LRRHKLLFHHLLPLLVSSFSFAGVTVSSPADGSTSGSPVHFAAVASSQYASVASMTINVDSQNMYTIYAASLDTYLPLAPGSHHILVKAWDNQGNYFDSPLTVNVTASNSSGAGGSVNVSQPVNNQTVGTGVHFIASASSSSAPISSMTINIDTLDVYKVYAGQVDTWINVGPGTHQVYVKAWDNLGHYFDQVLTIYVNSAASSANSANSNATTIPNIQSMPGWESCDVCAGAGGNGPSVQHSMTQNIANPSLSGASTIFWIGPGAPYSDVLWWKRLAPSSTASHFVYDLYFYIGDINAAQALEFDIFYSRDGKKNYFGSECDTRGWYAGTWQVWNGTDAWVHTGYPCRVQPNAWNHVTIELYRTPEGMTHFVSESMNGEKQTIDQEYPPIAVDAFEMNAAVQLDGNENQVPYKIWVDKMTLTYW